MDGSNVLNNAQFSFEGLTIERIIVHRVYDRGPDKARRDPKVSSNIIRLGQEALDALQLRLQKALGSKSHGIEMSIHETTPPSFFQVAASMMGATELEFVEASKILALSLHKSQLTTSSPGGMLAIIGGRLGTGAKPFIGVIKAEPQDGFKANESDDQVDMEYIAELVLTGTQRLYKIGLLTELVSASAVGGQYSAANFRAFLFDHLMTATETRAAAAFFYRIFLGMDIQASAKKLTQDFFELTRTFIDTSRLESEKKFELHEALRSEMRSQEATLSVATFAVRHLPDTARQEYEGFMQTRGFPQNSVSKDNDYIKTKLRRRRRFVFSNGIFISTPPERTEEYMQIEDSGEEGVSLIRIKGVLQGQE